MSNHIICIPNVNNSHLNDIVCQDHCQFDTPKQTIYFILNSTEIHQMLVKYFGEAVIPVVNPPYGPFENVSLFYLFGQKDVVFSNRTPSEKTVRTLV